MSPATRYLKPQRASTPLGTNVGNPRSADEARMVDQGGNFNPTVARDSTTRIYNDNGETNASSDAEANRLATRAYDASQTPRGRAIMARRANQAKNKELVQAMRQSATSDAARVTVHRIAQQVGDYVKEYLDYESWHAQVVNTFDLDPGERHFIERDVRSTAYAFSPDGQGIVTQVKGLWVPCEQFTIQSFTEIALGDRTHVSWDIVGRMRSTQEQELGRERDKRVIKLIDEAATDVNDLIEFFSVGTAVFEQMRYSIDKHPLQCDKFLIHRQQLSDILVTMAGTLDPVSKRELHLSGMITNFFGCAFLVSSGLGPMAVVEPGTMYAVAAPEYVGECATRENITKDYDRASHHEAKEGIMAYNMLSLGVGNARALVKATRAS